MTSIRQDESVILDGPSLDVGLYPPRIGSNSIDGAEETDDGFGDLDTPMIDELAKSGSSAAANGTTPLASNVGSSKNSDL